MTDQTSGPPLLLPRQSAADLHELLGQLLNSPAEKAIARVRDLHRQEYGSCVECTHAFSVAWPCATIRALDEPAPAPPATQATERPHCPCNGVHFPTPDNCRWCKCHRTRTTAAPAATQATKEQG